jgi:hypothetical protein
MIEGRSDGLLVNGSYLVITLQNACNHSPDKKLLSHKKDHQYRNNQTVAGLKFINKEGHADGNSEKAHQILKYKGLFIVVPPPDVTDNKKGDKCRFCQGHYDTGVDAEMGSPVQTSA